MKVLHVAQPIDGGVAGVVISLAGDQQSRGWEPTVACPPQGLLPDTMRAAGIGVSDWPATRSPGPGALREIRALARIIAEVQPDVVHLHGSKAGLAGRLAVRGKAPTIFQPHLWSFQSEPGPTVRPATAWERFAARWTDRFVCVSEDELQAGRAAGIDGEAVVICNGIDTVAVRPLDRATVRHRLGLPDSPTAVCVGRLAPLKGQDMLLEAWPEILATVPDARLLFVGDGPLRGELQSKYAISADPSVTWIGWSNTIAEYMAAANVVVVPSRAEGMALVPLEAMASGRAVVAFEAGGIRQSVGDGGVVLGVGDIGGLAREVSGRLLDTALADRDGSRGRARVERHFDKRVAADAVADLVVALSSRVSV